MIFERKFYFISDRHNKVAGAALQLIRIFFSKSFSVDSFIIIETSQSVRFKLGVIVLLPLVEHISCVEGD